MINYSHWFIRARLKTRQLLLLVALAEEGNIHRAAQVLNMTQPAASKLLKDLEDVLEVSLFDRLPRGMRATWYGEVMIRHARVALASLNQALAEEPTVAMVRPGHPLLGVDNLSLRDLTNSCWIVPPQGGVLRHRFDLMFREAGLDGPSNLIETTAPLFVTKMIGVDDVVC